MIQRLKNHKITPTTQVNAYLSQIPTAQLKDGITLYDLLKRPEIQVEHLKEFIEINEQPEIVEQVQIQIKYEDIFKKQNEKQKKWNV